MAVLSVPSPYATVAAAVAAAQPGDTIQIAGTYAGSETVTVGVNNLTFDAPATVTNMVLNLSAGATVATLTGTSNFVLRGTGAADTLTGNAGDNVLRGNLGNDLLNGRGGSDDADYANATGSVTVTLTDQVDGFGQLFGAASGAAGSDVLSSIENIRGSAFADTLTGNSQDNIIRGNAGDDFINGGAHFTGDTASYQAATGSVTVTLTDQVDGFGQFYGFSSGADGNDTLSGIERLWGSDFNDVLTGNSEDNVLRGNLGNDLLNGAGGLDAADYANAGGAVQVYLTDTVDGLGQLFGGSSGAAGNDTLSGIEDVRGSAFADVLIGNSRDNTLRGNRGDDIILGGAGRDAADYFTASGAVQVILTDTVDGYGQLFGVSYGADGNDTLSGIEDVYGGMFADTLIGNSQANTLRGNGGDDFLNGGGGQDGASYFFATGAVQVYLTDIVDGLGQFFGGSTGADGNDVLSGIEDVGGSRFNDVLIGNSQNNGLRGNRGDDFINGAAGNDTASYSLASGAVQVFLTDAVDGYGQLFGASYGADGNDTLSGIENLLGGAFADVLVGNSQDNILTGSRGNDTILGGAGRDTADYASASGAVQVVLTDTVDGYGQLFGVSYGADGSDLLSGIEDISGSAFGDSLVGNSQANILRGNGGDDFLNGRGGQDGASYFFANGAVQVYLTDIVDGLGQFFGGSTGADGNDVLSGIEDLGGSRFNDVLIGNSQNNGLRGNAGDDFINGGAGSDTASYLFASGAVQVFLTDALDGYGQLSGSSSGADGNDTLSGIENITGSAFADILVGNSQDNVLTGNGGNDIIVGGAGRDTADYASASGAVQLILTDTVDGYGQLFGVSYGADGSDTLSGVESLRGGNFADYLSGNSQSNTLTGGAGDDQIFGGAGADRIVGGLGSDALFGGTAAGSGAGSGNDIFVLDGAAGVDVIYDFEGGVGVGDTVELLSSANGGFYSSAAAAFGALQQIGSNVFLQVDADSSVVFLNRTVGQFASDDFLLV